MHDIAPAELEDIDVTIMLANRDTITPLGIVRDVEVLCGKIKYPTDFLVLGSQQDNFCPIICGRPLNTVKAEINCLKEKVRVTFGDIYIVSLIFPNLVDNHMIKNFLVMMRLLVLLLLSYLLLIR
jgi:hypothetical protein